MSLTQKLGQVITLSCLIYGNFIPTTFSATAPQETVQKSKSQTLLAQRKTKKGETYRFDKSYHPTKKYPNVTVDRYEYGYDSVLNDSDGVGKIYIGNQRLSGNLKFFNQYKVDSRFIYEFKLPTYFDSYTYDFATYDPKYQTLAFGGGGDVGLLIKNFRNGDFGIRLVGSPRPIRERNKKPCNDDQIEVEYDKSDPNYHVYTVETSICRTNFSGCTQQKVFNTMVSQNKFIAPTLDTNPVRNCQILNLIPSSPIRTIVNRDKYYIINFTRKNHTFHPGLVLRAVVKSKDNRYISIYTYGIGTTEKKKRNMAVANPLWTYIDMRVIREVIKRNSLRR